MGKGLFCLAGNDYEGHSRRKCSDCSAVYSALWRLTPKGQKRSKEYNERIKNTNMAKAKTEVFKAVRSGSLDRPNSLFCLDCGRKAQVYDHRDYNFPLDVDPVCRKCNKKRGIGLNWT